MSSEPDMPDRRRLDVTSVSADTRSLSRAIAGAPGVGRGMGMTPTARGGCPDTALPHVIYRPRLGTDGRRAISAGLEHGRCAHRPGLGQSPRMGSQLG
jgi:hypothetical protein